MNCFSLPESISIPDSVKKIGREIFLNKSSSYNNGYYGFYWKKQELSINFLIKN